MTATEHALTLVRAAAAAAAEKLGQQIVAFDVSDQLAITGQSRQSRSSA